MKLIIKAAASENRAGNTIIGELLVVVVNVFPSDSRHTGRMCFNAQSPAGNVDLMDTVIPGVTRAEGVPPVPIVMMAVALEGHHWRGA